MSDLYRCNILISDFERIFLETNDYINFGGKRILISGATGVIGKYLVAYFCYLREIVSEKFELYVIGRDEQRFLDSIEGFDLEPIVFIEYDLSSFELIPDISTKFDLIFHLASPASPKHFTDQLSTLTPNIFGTFNLLHLLNKSGIFLLASTSGVYGELGTDDHRPFKENVFGKFDPHHPTACYIEGKRAAETLVKAFCESEHSLDYRIIRFSICFGPGISRNDGRLFSDLTYCLYDKKPLILTSLGLVKRNFTYLSDCLSGIFLTLGKGGENNKIFNLASRESVRILDLVETLGEKFGISPAYVGKQSSIGVVAPRYEAHDSSVSVDALENLGWRRSFDVYDSFARTVEYLEEGKAMSPSVANAKDR